MKKYFLFFVICFYLMGFMGCKEQLLIRAVRNSDNEKVCSILDSGFDVPVKTLFKVSDIGCNMDIWVSLCKNSTQIYDIVDDQNLYEGKSISFSFIEKLVMDGKIDYVFALANAGFNINYEVLYGYLGYFDNILKSVKASDSISVEAFFDVLEKNYPEEFYLELIDYVGDDINDSCYSDVEFKFYHILCPIIRLKYKDLAFKVLRRKDVQSIGSELWFLTRHEWDEVSFCNPYWDYLIDIGCDLSSCGTEVLLSSIFIRDIFSIKFLLNNGVDINKEFKGEVPSKVVFDDDFFIVDKGGWEEDDGPPPTKEVLEAVKKDRQNIKYIREIFIKKQENPNIIFKY